MLQLVGIVKLVAMNQINFQNKIDLSQNNLASVPVVYGALEVGSIISRTRIWVPRQSRCVALL